MNYPIRTFVEIEEEELNQLKQTIIQQQAELDRLKKEWDYWYTLAIERGKTQEPDCYGDGNVYRGVRSKDSEVQTIHIGGVKELTDEEIEILKEIIRITDRKHPLWDKAKEFLK